MTTATILDGKCLAQELRNETQAEVAAFVARTGVVPKLQAVLVGDDPASAVYIRNKERACHSVGIASSVARLPSSISQLGLLEALESYNADPSIHGVLLQLPIPRHIAVEAMLDAIHPHKDVDAFHPENVGRILQGRPRFLPCTPAGVCELLRRAHIPTAGQRVVIVGRSDIVGKPLAAMLMQRGVDATVTVCHSRTKDLAYVTREADILIAAIGQPEFITADMVQNGAAVIDVGINRVGDHLVGDVEFVQVSRVAGHITPVPGGVGPLTIAMLLRNTLYAARLAAREVPPS